MPSTRPPHVVLKGSIEYTLLASASPTSSLTRQQLLHSAVERGLKRYDELTVLTALRRLTAAGLLDGQRGYGNLYCYRLTPEGQHLLTALEADLP